MQVTRDSKIIGFFVTKNLLVDITRKAPIASRPSITHHSDSVDWWLFHFIFIDRTNSVFHSPHPPLLQCLLSYCQTRERKSGTKETYRIIMKSSNLIRVVATATSFAACCGFAPMHQQNTNNHEIQLFYSKPGMQSKQFTSTSLGMSSIGVLGSKSLRKKKLKTFVRYLEVECWKQDEIRDLEPVLQAVAEACKQINRIVQRAKTDDLYGVALEKDGVPIDGTNIQGEVQQKLDILCNTIMMRAFCGCSSAIHSVASEEEDEARCCADVMVSRTWDRASVSLRPTQNCDCLTLSFVFVS